MQSLIRCAWLRRTGLFWVGIALLLGTLFSWEKPAEAASRSSRVEQRTTRTVVAYGRSRGRWIEVDLSSQRLIAWEGGRRVYSIPVSTGKRSTPTPTGTFAIQSKLRSTRMRGRDYDVSNVPNTMYYAGGYAIHGAYWHNRFGTRVSHGCINLPVSQSRKLFKWADVGTRVVVHS